MYVINRIIVGGFLAAILLLIVFLIAVSLSGIFIWIALKLVGENRGIIEAGIANLVAYFIASIVLTAVLFVPLINLFAPIFAFIIYVSVLSSILKIKFYKGFLVSIISYLIFIIITSITGALLGAPVYWIHTGRPFFRLPSKIQH